MPRKLNTLCSRILLFGAIEELDTIDKKVVTNVIEDMERDIASSGGGHQNANSNGSGRTAKAGTGHDGQNLTMGSQELEDLKERLFVLEKYVKVHDETIKGALDIVTRLMDSNEDQEANSHDASNQKCDDGRC